jgi:hypothetical protein
VPTRQKREDIERKPKTVHYLSSWADPDKIMKDPEKAKAVAAAVSAIKGGAPLPTGYYRKGVGKTPDALLATHGIMHLHLGKPNTKELLYLVQYPDDVVLLELSGHAHFTSKPIGRVLLAAHKTALAALEAKLDAKPKPVRPPQTVAKVRTGKIPTRPVKPKAPKTDPT